MRKFSLMAVATALFSVASYGQTTCTPDLQKPAIGTTYEYRVSISPANLQNPVYQWYVTQKTNLFDADILQSVNDFFSVENGSDYNSTTSTKESISLKWKPDALVSGEPFVLVLKYKGNNGTCDVSNVKAMRITPLNNFRLTVEPSDETGGTFAGKVCSPEVSSAVFDPVANNVKYAYGETTLYYKVTSTGYDGNWIPSITLPALNEDAGATNPRKYNSVQWKEGNGTWKDFGTIQNGGKGTQSLIGSVTTEKSFVIKVVIGNGSYEGLADEDIQLTTKGEMQLQNAVGKQNPRDVSDDCSPLNTDRNATQTILARPTITPQAGATFITELK